MADDTALTDVVRRAAQVNATFYKGWMDLSLEYVRNLSQVFGSAAGTNQSFSPIQEMDSGAAALVLEGEAGTIVRGSFLVSNDLERGIACQFIGSDFTDPSGGTLKLRTTFDPPALQLAAGQQQVVGVMIPIDETLNPGVGYAGELSIGGMEGFSVPVIVRRQHSVADEPADDAAVGAQSQSPQPAQSTKATKRKSAQKKRSRRT